MPKFCQLVDVFQQDRVFVLFVPVRSSTRGSYGGIKIPQADTHERGLGLIHHQRGIDRV